MFVCGAKFRKLRYYIFDIYQKVRKGGETKKNISRYT